MLGFDVTNTFLSQLDSMFELLVPAYEGEGKSYLTVALGCTGGHHRSVVVAEHVRATFDRLGFQASVTHRDIAR